MYPIPIKGHPFGGSHSCATIDGKVKLGPAMIPSLNYEDYESSVDKAQLDEKYGFIFKANPNFYQALVDLEIPLLDLTRMIKEVSKIH